LVFSGQVGGDAEVRELDLFATGVNQNVLRFDVFVNHALTIETLQNLGNLNRKPQKLSHWQTPNRNLLTSFLLSCSPFPVPCSLFPVPCSLFPIPHSPFPRIFSQRNTAKVFHHQGEAVAVVLQAVGLNDAG